MKIAIAERFHPFSHANGTKFMLPQSTWSIQIFPTRLYFTDLENRCTPFDISFDFLGPLKVFTAELNLEQGELYAFGMTKKGFMRLSLSAKTDGVWLTMQKVPGEKVVCRRSFAQEPLFLFKAESVLISPSLKGVELEVDQERLSLGMHKAQEWESMRRRLDFKEIFPLWLSLCAWIPLTQTESRKAGNFLLLEECRRRVEGQEKTKILEAFETFFLSSFEGVLTPRLFDAEHQGIFPETLSFPEGAPLALLTEGGRLIRSLFFQDTVTELAILPCLLPSFVSGRMTGIKTSRNALVDFEWTKNFLRRMRITSSIGGELCLKLPQGVASFRCKKGRTTLKKVSVDLEGRAVLALGANQSLHLDRFES